METKTIAIITDKGAPCKQITQNTLINVFRLEEDKVSGFESIRLESCDNNSLSRLLKLKKISLVYIDTLNHELKSLLQKLGIGIKCKDQWEGDEFIGKFVFG
ncbi:hypothetical protein GGR21_003211 [Dysgonomonas hofstadii]|uniref:Dinitrogenase iron-molybdenum cofactor biosynthesis domain-containing protein n=1 Tax=Dysgonomonas hofstadii TaxID=637886 RepID=A0A840CUD0_9BACT|nr:hypothetical protein [Dysgonomonas hofstadii]MBB4037294.1 hypothetical protein [Dysgonomonas hofstadii]